MSVRLQRRLWMIAVGLLCLIALWFLGARLLFELGGPTNRDSNLYFAVGRGILNGLVPYRDLFETKPPGIFFLSALSFGLTGTPYLMSILEALCIAGIVIAITWAAIRETADADPFIGMLWVGLAFVFSVILALYTGLNAGRVQTEGYGVFFGVLFVVLLFVGADRRGWKGIGLLTLSMICAVGLKEPFGLAMGASALLLCPDVRAFVRGCIVPGCIAAALGLFLLWMLGYLGPYVSIYLHEMFQIRVNHLGPVWQRGFNIVPIFKNLRFFQTFFPILLAGMAGAWLILSGRAQSQKMRAWKGVTFLLAGYCTLIAVGSGAEYRIQHFIFAVPFEAALFLLFLRTSIRQEKRMEEVIRMGLLVLVTLVLLLHHRSDYSALLAGSREVNDRYRQAAARIDQVLDACHFDRYMYLGDAGPYGYTRHSPYGPLFFQQAELFDDRHPFFLDGFLDGMKSAPFLVLGEFTVKDWNDLVQQYLSERFVTTPLPCAKDVPLPPAPYIFYYRLGEPVPRPTS